MKLNKYFKTRPKYSVTSVNLERQHVEFLKEKDLNLSLLVRDFLDSLIEVELERQKRKELK